MSRPISENPGTAVGDPVEVEAIGRALGVARSPQNPLPIGSVKGNLGHLETASGVPGLLKAIHALRHRVVPPSIGIRRLNPRLPLDTYHLEVLRESRQLAARGELYIGINSFGFGGANAHVLLQSPPSPPRRRKARWPRQGRHPQTLPLLLSAETASALQQSAADLAAALEGERDADYPRLYQVNFRRPQLREGLLLRANSSAELRAALQDFAAAPDSFSVACASRLGAARGPVFVYSGNGCQWLGMGRALLDEPVFAASIERIDEHFLPLAGYRLGDDLAGKLGDAERYNATEYAQPALFALQVGMTEYLRAQGIEPAAVLAHSVGEVAAAWACGALSLADAVRVIFQRSHLQAQTRGQGQMTAVAGSGDETQSWIRESGVADALAVAAWNSPKGCTVVGPADALSILEKWLRKRGTAYKRLPIDYPFHSAGMDPIRPQLLQELADLAPQPAQIPFLSVVRGAAIAGTELDAEYWWQNIRAPVRFAQAAQASLAHGNVFVELGGHPVLRGYLQETLDAAGETGRIIETQRRNNRDIDPLWRSAANIWLAGIPRRWEHYFPTPAAPVDLPQYPWERERHWQEASAESARTLFAYAVHPLLGHPVAQHPGEWEQELDLDRQPWLADHRVGDGVVLAGAAYAEIFLAAARQQHPEESGWMLEEMEIFAPLLLQEGSSKVLRLRLDGEGWAEISARNRLETRWTRHARALLTAAPQPPAPQQFTSESGQVVSAAEHYARTKAAGLQYGPYFQTVRGGSTGVEGLQVELALAHPADGEYLLHPTLLDGALQSMADWLVHRGHAEAGWGFVPVRIQRLGLYRAGARQVRGQLQIRRHTPQSLLVDIQLRDQSGALVATCMGLRLRRLRLQASDQQRLRFLVQHWQPLPPVELAPLPDEALCSLLSQPSAAAQRYITEYSPLLESLLNTYRGEANGEPCEVPAIAIWRTLLSDYPEFFPLTLAAGRWGLGRRGEAGEASTLEEAAIDALFLPAQRQLQAELPRTLRAMLDTLPAHRPLRVAEAGSRFWMSPLAAVDDPCLYRAKQEADLLYFAWDRLELGWEALQDLADSAAAGALLLVQGIEPEAGWEEVDGQRRLPCRSEIIWRLQQWGWELVAPSEDTTTPGTYCLLLRRLPVTQATTKRQNVSFLVDASQLPSLRSLLQEYLPAAELLSTAALPNTAQSSQSDVFCYLATIDGPQSLAEQCATIISLGRWAVRQEPVPRLWVVSLATVSVAAEQRLQLAPRAAALHGLVRSLANEWPELRLGSIDLGVDLPNAAQFAALQRELSGAGEESELRIGSAGERWAARVAERALPHSKPAAGQAYRLGFSQPGQLRHLHWTTQTLAALPADGVRVEVRHAGLNFRDVMYALGLLPDEALENGFSGPGLGLEFAGIVTAVGSAVSRFAPGDAVLGFAPHSFSSQLQTHADHLFPLPPGLDLALAAGLPTVFFTAWYALREMARLQAAERILIHGAAGGVGIAAIQIAQELGAEIYASAGSAAKRDFLRLLEIPHIYDSRRLDFAEEILRDTDGAGVDVILNSLSGPAIRRNLQILRPFGRFLELGKRDFYANTPMGLRPFRNNLSYFGIDADQLLAQQPEYSQRLFTDLLTGFADGRFFALPSRHFAATEAEEAFRFMQQARQIGKVIIDLDPPFTPLAPARPQDWGSLRLDPEAWYLVSGGTAGFGLATAKRLHERGARHLLLISRSGQMDATARAAFIDAGTQLWTPAADIGNAAAMAEIFATLRQSGRPLRGVIHAAAVIEDALAERLDAEQIERVLHPKIAGAWQLHVHSQGQPLDFFVLYSSVSSLLGNPGQSAYVAANAWMEELAAERRQRGLPALAVAWGAIADAGYLTRHEKTASILQQRLGAAPIASAAALDVLESLLAADASGLTVVDFDAQALRRFLPAARGPRFADLLAELPAEDEQVDSNLLDRLAEISEAEAEGLLRQLICQEVAGILRLQVEKIGADQPLQELGLDSLMGVELALALEERVGVKLPSFLLSEGPTPKRLAQRILQMLRGDAEKEDAALQRVAQQHGVTELPNEARKDG
ncbi:MAG: SDR family NAD(P)-dependent oxidoreductase [Candidatus Igneacidithiobacillus chanchocoensis]